LSLVRPDAVHIYLRSLSLVFLLGLLSCSPRDFLTRRLAADLISASPAFTEPQVFWL